MIYFTVHAHDTIYTAANKHSKLGVIMQMSAIHAQYDVSLIVDCTSTE